MSDQNQLNEILKNTAQTAERTRNIEHNLAQFQKRYVKESNSKDARIAKLETKTHKNSIILTAMVGAITILFTSFTAYVFELI